MISLSQDITIVGLGPGHRQLRTILAQGALDSAPRLFLRTANHPGVDDLLQHERVFVLDENIGDRAEGGKDWVAGARIVCDAAESGRVALAVPGHPRFGESLVLETIAEATRRGLGAGIVDGLSVIDLVANTLRFDPIAENVQVIDANQAVNADGDMPFVGGLFPFTPLRPMLFCRVYGNGVAAPLSRLLQRLFPPDHELTLVEAAGVEGEQRSATLTIAALAETHPGPLVSLWVPALGQLDALRDPRTLQHIAARLRAPGGCPWDREQTHRSLRDNVIDEAYEVLDAIDAGDASNLAEELGDLFLLICMHAQIGEESGTFTLEDVYEGITRKIIRRHPHVFGDVVAREAGDLAAIWAAAKAQEKAEHPDRLTKAVDGQPHSMPALVRAPKVLRKHPVLTEGQQPGAEERSRALLKAVADIVAAGDDPERILREALTYHATSNTMS